MNYGPFALCADRWTVFADTIEVTGLDTNGIQVRMQVRLTPDTPGDPLASLGGVSDPDVQGLYTLDVDDTGAVPISTLGVRITDVSTFPAAPEIGADAVFAWDLLATVDGVLQRIAAGPFIVSAGVTRP